jgi:hypothetical protein
VEHDTDLDCGTDQKKDTDTWFHDFLHEDGTPYRPEDVELLIMYTGQDDPTALPGSGDD